MSKPSPAISRLQKELKEITNNPLPWAKVSVVGDDLFKWKLVIDGPENTPYEKGVFTIDMNIPPEYPFKSPKVRNLYLIEFSTD